MGDPAGVKAMSASALAIARLHDAGLSLLAEESKQVQQQK